MTRLLATLGDARDPASHAYAALVFLTAVILLAVAVARLAALAPLDP